MRGCEIQIDKDVPIPPDGRGGEHGNRKYPLSKMEIGDSIVMPHKSRNVLYFYKRRHPEFNFIIRRHDKDGNVRVWRVAPVSDSDEPNILERS